MVLVFPKAIPTQREIAPNTHGKILEIEQSRELEANH